MLCTICGFEGKPGLALGNNARESMKCPECSGTSRQRAVARAFLECVPIEHRSTNLKNLAAWANFVGSELQTYEVGWSVLSPFLHIAGEHVVSEMKPRNRAVVQNLEELTFDDRRFHIVICSDVLEHVRLYKRALAELTRVLKPGGHLIITVPLHGDAHCHRPYCIIDPEEPANDVWASDAPVHKDPLDSAGCRVYRHFGRVVLIHELFYVGLSAHMTCTDLPENGIRNSMVFIARKRG